MYVKDFDLDIKTNGQNENSNEISGNYKNNLENEKIS